MIIMLNRISTFKDRLNEALVIREIRPVDLAKRTGISESTISQYRSGYAEPKANKLDLIAKTLSVDPSWLMGLDVPMKIRIDANNLSDEAKEMIELYNQATPEVQRLVRYALGLAEQDT